LFVSGEARWLGVQVAGQPKQPRVLLLSVPYALKAADAETIGGLPPSAFVLAAPPSSSNTIGTSSSSTETVVNAAVPPAGAVTGSGIVNFVPLWTSASNIGNSVVFQSGTGTTAKTGINTTTPATTLDVKGAATVRGNLSLPATGTATATAGKNSQTVTLTSSVFNSSSTTPVNENFRWQAEPLGNNTTTATGSLNLLFAQGTGTFAETGLKFGSNGRITFATGQTFPGTGKGTITGVTAGTDLTGGGTSGSVTLNLDPTKVPQLNASNTFTASQSVTGGISASGEVSGATGFFGNTPGSTALTVNQNTDGAAIEAFSADSIAVYGVSDTDDAIVGLAGAATFAGVFGETVVQGGYAFTRSTKVRRARLSGLRPTPPRQPTGRVPTPYMESRTAPPARAWPVLTPLPGESASTVGNSSAGAMPDDSMVMFGSTATCPKTAARSRSITRWIRRTNISTTPSWNRPT